MEETGGKNTVGEGRKEKMRRKQKEFRPFVISFVPEVFQSNP